MGPGSDEPLSGCVLGGVPSHSNKSRINVKLICFIYFVIMEHGIKWGFFVFVFCNFTPTSVKIIIMGLFCCPLKLNNV